MSCKCAICSGQHLTEDHRFREGKDDFTTLGRLLDEKYDDIEHLLSVIREIYALAGEDSHIAELCNGVLESSRFSR